MYNISQPPFEGISLFVVNLGSSQCVASEMWLLFDFMIINNW